MTASHSAWRALLWRVLVASLASAAMATHVAAQSKATRPVVGVALGGGSARGFAHVGVIRWFEEHHVPIDVIAGTNMGGLIGGAYAAGMSSDELAALLRSTDWDERFGASAYGYKNVRRGVARPTALNNGQQVDFMLSRIGALYAGLPSFDALPTPFRCVAVDLRTATAVVLDSGSLPAAMRATMSLPGVFPPVELRGRVLVDGEALDNVPADVVRAMGADVVIAVDIGSSADTSDVRHSAYGHVNGTKGATRRANTRRSFKSASFVIAPDLAPFGTLDWRKAAALAVSGYNAAQEMSADLLPLAVDDATWKKYLAKRAAKRHLRMPAIARLDVRGATAADTRTIRTRLQWQLRQPLNPVRIENELLRLGALDHYISVGWDLSVVHGAYSLVVKARRDSRSQPLLTSSSTTNNDFYGRTRARFGTRPVPTDQYILGLPLKLDGFSIGERRGDNCAVLTIPYLRMIGRLADFLGGPLIAVASLENGSAFDDILDADPPRVSLETPSERESPIDRRPSRARTGRANDRSHSHPYAGD